MWEFTGKRNATLADGTVVQVESGPIVGIGVGPLTDAEFASNVAAYDAQYDPAEAGSVQASGLYVRTGDDGAAPVPEAPVEPEPPVEEPAPAEEATP